MVDSSEKPIIGISECLTESIVRYDAKSQANNNLTAILLQSFELLPICPEVECGLAVPRPPVELVEEEDEIKMTGRDDKNIDVTDTLINYSTERVCSLNHLSGYVFKARSPSCGVMTSPVHDAAGKIKRLGNGVFVDILLNQYPALPVVDDSVLGEKQVLNNFIHNVLNYARR